MRISKGSSFDKINECKYFDFNRIDEEKCLSSLEPIKGMCVLQDFSFMSVTVNVCCSLYCMPVCLEFANVFVCTIFRCLYSIN